VRRPLFLLLLASLAVKAAVLARFHAHPLLQPAGDIDGGVYARLAADVARGDLLLRAPGPAPFFVSPLYIYFLAAIHALSAGSLLAVKVVQIALGTAAVGLVFGTARRLFGDRAAVLAGILYALTGVVTFHEVLILQAALDPFLTALSLFLLSYALTPGRISSKVNGAGAEGREGALRATQGPASGSVSSKVNGGEERGIRGTGLGRWLAAGAAFGLLALNRPNALLCVAVIAAALAASSLVARRRNGQPLSPFEEDRRIKTPVARRAARSGRGLSLPLEENPLRPLQLVGAFLAGTGLFVALPLARNLVVSGEPVLISSHGGLNFLIGNGPAASGVYCALPGITPDIGGQAADTKRVAEAEERRPLSVREVSAHFSRKAWEWIRKNPGAASSLFLRKIEYTLSRDEAPLNFSYPWYRARSAALKLLFAGTGLLVPLAGAGFVLTFLAKAGAERRALLVWASFVPAYVLSVAAFFVATRYRLPLLAALAVLAGAGVVAAWDALRAGEARRLAIAGAVALPLAAVSLWPTGLYDGRADEDMHWALYLIEKGEADEAARLASAAATVHPDPGLFWLRIGKAWAAAGRMDDAIAALEKARAAEPHPPEVERRLAAAHESRGVDRVLANDASGALPDLEAAVALSPEDPGMLLNLAAALAEKGDRARARTLAERALALRPGYDKAEALLRALK
jgi:4-amino-4-deoxy-L-arabinose transferase-like glycosyltransferase